MFSIQIRVHKPLRVTKHFLNGLLTDLKQIFLKNIMVGVSIMFIAINQGKEKGRHSL